MIDCPRRLTHQLAQTPWVASVSYAKNPNLAEESNFGIGFYLGGATNSTSTGPIGNNQNQVYNPLINLTDTNLLAGYIVKTNGIQLGLATNVSGYAYTKLNPTGLTSTNSVPDWQTPTGQTVVNGVTNNPGSIVMDSGGAVGYNITPDTNNLLNPSFDYSKDPSNNVILSLPGSGIFSQNQPPYDYSFSIPEGTFLTPSTCFMMPRTDTWDC